MVQKAHAQETQKVIGTSTEVGYIGYQKGGRGLTDLLLRRHAKVNEGLFLAAVEK